MSGGVGTVSFFEDEVFAALREPLCDDLADGADARHAAARLGRPPRTNGDDHAEAVQTDRADRDRQEVYQVARQGPDGSFVSRPHPALTMLLEGRLHCLSGRLEAVTSSVPLWRVARLPDVRDEGQGIGCPRFTRIPRPP